MQDLVTLYKNYQKRYTVYTDALLHIPISQSCKVLVVIPCYDEDLKMTLQSLGNCTLTNPNEVHVLLVFNHSENAPKEVKLKHALQLNTYSNYTLKNRVKVSSLPAFNLPKKHAGVGLARKIGMDAAALAFVNINHNGLIVCLDGDCSVSKNYFAALLQAAAKKVNGLSLAFEHQKDGEHTPEMLKYELFLRYYIQALKYAQFKHAHHTIGSSMAVRSSKYLALGGMNKRKAGEDFYFLHKLMPHPYFYTLTACTVFPLPRFSERVPFGTGRAMLEMKNGTKDFETLYNPLIFKEIKEWLNDLKKDYTTPFNNHLTRFFVSKGLKDDFIDLQKRSNSQVQFQENFNYWFDGFKMLKLVHFLRDEYYPNLPILEAINGLFNTQFKTHLNAHQYLKTLDESKDL